VLEFNEIVLANNLVQAKASFSGKEKVISHVSMCYEETT
jgi:hypothetical protein